MTWDLEEQGDILHYMTEQYGLSFKVGISPAASDGGPGGTGRHPPLYDRAVRPLSFKVCISPTASDGGPGGTGRYPPLYDKAVRPLF